MLQFMNKLKVFIFVFFLFAAIGHYSSAIDFWRYPEAANRGTLFAGGLFASFEFSLKDPVDFDFSFSVPEFYLDYVLPVGLPFSLGTSLRAFSQEQFGISLRPAYHINLDVGSMDLYVMYPLTLYLSKKELLFQYGVGVGLRIRLADFFFMNVETYKLERIMLGVCLKLN